MKVRELKTQMHMHEWSKLIESCQASGLSIREWCRRNNLHQSRYYYYLKKLRLAACEGLPTETQGGSQFALVPHHSRISNPTVTSSSNIKITLSNAVVEIGEGADEVQVRLALGVLLNAQ